MQAPPTIGRRSTTRTRCPALARYAAATRPLWPPPTTMASHVPSMGRGARDSYVSLVGHSVVGLLRQTISGCLPSACRGRERGGRRKGSGGILEKLEKGVVLGDGGYLLELEKRGYVQPGPFTPEVVLEHPAAVRELHQEFLDAGAEVLQALAFYASKEKLATVGDANKVRDSNRAAVR